MTCEKQTDFMNVLSAFEEQVTRTPHRTAVISDAGCLSYRELDDRANTLAAALREAGIEHGDRVGLCCDRSPAMVVGLYAIVKSGAAYVPMDPAYPPARLEYMSRACEAKLLVTTESTASTARGIWQKEMLIVPTKIGPAAAAAGTHLETKPSGFDLIYVIFTSGTTGQPKGAGVYHRGFANLVNWYADGFSIDETDRFLLVTSLSFDLTQKNFFAPLHRGGTLCLLQPGAFEIPRLMQAIEEWGITRLNCTPSLFYPLVENPEEFARLRSLKTVFLGGEPIRMDRLRQWLTHESCHAEVVNTYGPTECSDIAVYYRVGKEDIQNMESVPLGFALPNVDLMVVNEKKEQCLEGETGELLIGGIGVGAGYVNDAELTAERFIQNPTSGSDRETFYRTGDLVRSAAGGCLEFLGRVDHQVKVRGFRIELLEIEEAAGTYEGVREVAVIARTESGNTSLHCFYSPKPGATVSSSALRDFLRERLPEHSIPSFFREIRDFPLSPNGKVDRLALAAMLPSSSLESKSRGSAPRSADILVRPVWEEVLGNDHFSDDDNFFEIGGDSLLAAQVHAKLQKRQGREFPIAELFAHSTVRRLTQYLTLNGEPSPSDGEISRRAERQRRAIGAAARNRR